MKRLLLVVLLIVGCEAPNNKLHRIPKKERPAVNLPLSLRQHNWIGNRGEGSCVWASTITLLRWQGRYQMADWIRQHYGNGEVPDDWAEKMDRAGIRYAYVTNGDVRFLEWCIRTRRGAAVTVLGGAHCVNLVHLDGTWAALIDNNAPMNPIWIPRKRFIAEWKASYGWALTVVYAPSAPLP